jgi:hypothetical protein
MSQPTVTHPYPVLFIHGLWIHASTGNHGRSCSRPTGTPPRHRAGPARPTLSSRPATIQAPSTESASSPSASTMRP